jgi:hypothetical protein
VYRIDSIILEIIMNARSNLFAALFAAATLLAFAPAEAGDTSDGSKVTAAQIEAARTPADHEAIARGYEEEATSLERKAAAHEAMARIYRGGGAPKAHAPNMTSHCERLVAQYRGAATAARALAAEHRAAAGTTGQ